MVVVVEWEMSTKSQGESFVSALKEGYFRQVEIVVSIRVRVQKTKFLHENKWRIRL